MGAIGSLAEGREVIRRSFPVETFEPQDVAQWDDGYHAAALLRDDVKLARR